MSLTDAPHKKPGKLVDFVTNSTVPGLKAVLTFEEGEVVQQGGVALVHLPGLDGQQVLGLGTRVIAVTTHKDNSGQVAVQLRQILHTGETAAERVGDKIGTGGRGDQWREAHGRVAKHCGPSLQRSLYLAQSFMRASSELCRFNRLVGPDSCHLQSQTSFGLIKERDHHQA
jgi:hypothetical protein